MSGDGVDDRSTTSVQQIISSIKVPLVILAPRLIMRLDILTKNACKPFAGLRLTTFRQCPTFLLQSWRLKWAI